MRILLSDEEQDILEFANRLKIELARLLKTGEQVSPKMEYCIGGLWEVMERLGWSETFMP